MKCYDHGIGKMVNMQKPKRALALVTAKGTTPLWMIRMLMLMTLVTVVKVMVMVTLVKIMVSLQEEVTN